MIKIKKNFLLIVIIMFLLCSCNDTNSKQDESKVVSDNIVQEESIEEKFTVDEVVEYLCSEEVKDREYNKEGNQKTTEYINELYKQLNLEFVFGKSYLDNFFCDDINTIGNDVLVGWNVNIRSSDGHHIYDTVTKINNPIVKLYTVGNLI